MYLTQSNVIRSLSKEEYAMLREMCQYSNNLYNVALYNIRQYYFQEKKFLKYEENYHVCKENVNISYIFVKIYAYERPHKHCICAVFIVFGYTIVCIKRIRNEKNFICNTRTIHVQYTKNYILFIASMSCSIVLCV